MYNGADSTSIEVVGSPEEDGGINSIFMKRIGQRKLYEETSGRRVG